MRVVGSGSSSGHSRRLNIGGMGRVARGMAPKTWLGSASGPTLAAPVSATRSTEEATFQAPHLAGGLVRHLQGEGEGQRVLPALQGDEEGNPEALQ